MELPCFDFDFSFLSRERLAEQCITTDEIEDIFYDVRSFYADYHATEDIGYMIGFSRRNKFIAFTFRSPLDEQLIRLTDLYLSIENEIRHWYFGPR